MDTTLLRKTQTQKKQPRISTTKLKVPEVKYGQWSTGSGDGTE